MSLRLSLNPGLGIGIVICLCLGLGFGLGMGTGLVLGFGPGLGQKIYKMKMVLRKNVNSIESSRLWGTWSGWSLSWHFQSEWLSIWRGGGCRWLDGPWSRSRCWKKIR